MPIIIPLSSHIRFEFAHVGFGGGNLQDGGCSQGLHGRLGSYNGLSQKSQPVFAGILCQGAQGGVKLGLQHEFRLGDVNGL